MMAYGILLGAFAFYIIALWAIDIVKDVRDMYKKGRCELVTINGETYMLIYKNRHSFDVIKAEVAK